MKRLQVSRVRVYHIALHNICRQSNVRQYVTRSTQIEDQIMGIKRLSYTNTRSFKLHAWVISNWAKLVSNC